MNAFDGLLKSVRLALRLPQGGDMRGRAFWYLVAGIVGCGLLASIASVAEDWEEFLLLTYVALACLAGVSAFLFAWGLAIMEKGVVVGGIIGLIPAFVFACLSCAAWPLELIFLLVARKKGWLQAAWARYLSRAI